MSRLYYTEEGRILPALGEELTRHRRARKILALPATQKEAEVYFLAYAHPETRSVLYLLVNGCFLVTTAPNREWQYYAWYRVTVPPEVLRTGDNVFEFWTDSVAMDSWALALELGNASPQSMLSTDGGMSWQNRRMGYLHVGPGEYVVRVRLAEQNGDQPPAPVFENPNHPRLTEFRQVLPSAALLAHSTLEKTRLLSTWVCTQWDWTADTVVYSPWDASTILAWGRSTRGIFGYRPTAMCVHFGVTFVTACQAVGLKARCMASTTGLNHPGGHFTAEVWMPEYGKWVWVDPNLDAMMFDHGVPLSVPEIRARIQHLPDFCHFGDGLSHQMNTVAIRDIIDNGYYLKAYWMNYRCIWPRSDFFTHPEESPTAHGSSHYCETGLVWEKNAYAAGLGMYPFYAEDLYFDCPPEENR